MLITDGSVLLLGLVLVLAPVAALQRHWQLGSLREVVVEACARLIPRPRRSVTASRAAMLRQLSGAVQIRPTGYDHAAQHLLVRVAPGSDLGSDLDGRLGGSVGSEGLGVLARDLQRLYIAHARQHGWTMLDEPTVTVEVDVRLQTGWIRVQAIYGKTYALPTERAS